MITNLQLVEYAKKAIGLPYFYGTFGHLATKALYNAKKKQYPKYYDWEYKTSYNGKRVFDCVGLIKGALWSGGNFSVNPKYKRSEDLSANGMFNKCKNTGNISNIPEVVGLLVWCDGHIGIYAGNGYVIEARGHAYGVQKNKLSARGFKKYGYCPFVTYQTAPNPEKPVVNAKYFPKCKTSYYSIVDALKSVGAGSNYIYRKEIATANGIKRYCGSAQQNIDMLNMLKAGKLKRP